LSEPMHFCLCSSNTAGSLIISDCVASYDQLDRFQVQAELIRTCSRMDEKSLRSLAREISSDFHRHRVLVGLGCTVAY